MLRRLVAPFFLTALLASGCLGPTASTTQPGTDAGQPTGTACSASPTMALGPYYIDAPERGDIREDREGKALTLTLTIHRRTAGSCVPLQGAQVDVWHADAAGSYSGFAAEGTAGQDWLRGHGTTDASGQVAFVTIWPGWYPGRAVHIHVRVRDATTDFVSQLFFDDAVSLQVYEDEPYRSRGTAPDTPNERDAFYRNGGSRMVVVTQPGATGYAGAKTIVVP